MASPALTLSSLSRLSLPAKIGVGAFFAMATGVLYWVLFFTDISTKIEGAVRHTGEMQAELAKQQQAQAGYLVDRDELVMRQQRQRELNKILPAVPAWIYANLERWHYLPFLRTNNVREILKSARIRALEPEKIEALITVIEEDLGYQLHQAVQKVKFELSRSQSAEFRFRDGSPSLSSIDLRIPVTRKDFELWIKDELRAIEQCIDSLLQTAGVHPREVDRVFLTGGSSFVPAVRRIFTTRFGEERIRSGNEFTSVAHGLALRAAESLRSGSQS